MKKITLLFLLYSSFTLSQTKADTQIWIKSTIENYARKEVYNPLLNVYFNNGDIWFVELEDGGSYQNEMALKKINQVIIKSDTNGYILVLGCTYDNACSRIVRYKFMSDGTAKKVDSDELNKTGIKIYLQKSIENDKMIERLKKAITHLIQLNGGKVISNTF